LPKSSPSSTESSPTVIDVSGLVMGRAASLIAQRLLAGENIVVIRAEKAVITGSRASVLETYRANRARGSVRSGPHFPRNPDRIFRRAVRGMVPHLKSRGKVAFDRLTVYIGCPELYAKVSASSLPDAQARPTLRAPLTLEEVSRLLGARV
jgi:large subunit ribosomal protein L13